VAQLRLSPTRRSASPPYQAQSPGPDHWCTLVSDRSGFAEKLCNSEILENGIEKALSGDTGQKLIKEAMKKKRVTTAK